MPVTQCLSMYANQFVDTFKASQNHTETFYNCYPAEQIISFAFPCNTIIDIGICMSEQLESYHVDTLTSCSTCYHTVCYSKYTTLYPSSLYYLHLKILQRKAI